MILKIRTVNDKENFSDYLEALKENLFKQNSFAEIIKSGTSPYPALIKGALQKEGLENNKNNLKIMIEKIENELKLLKTINLMLSFEPNESIINAIYSWVTKNLGKKIVLNIEVKPEILGGAVISFNGLYSDFSLKRTLENVSIEKILKKHD